MNSSPIRRHMRRVNNHLGAFGMTAALGLFGIAGVAPQCAPAPAPAAAPAPAPAPAPAAVIAQVANVQDAVVASVNQHRAGAGRSPLAIDGRLTSAAQSHANDMAQRRAVTHTGSGGTNAGQRIQVYGYGWKTWTENVAGGQQTPGQVMTAWMDSAAHRANVLHDGMANIGVAATVGTNGVTYWVMVLAA